MKIAKVISNGKEIYAELKEGNYYPLKGDLYNYKGIENSPIKHVDKVLPPVMPTKIIAVGLNYNLHIVEFEADIPKYPIIFLKPTSSIIGEGDTIILPKASNRVDYEAEIAVVISKDCKNIKAGDAKDYILGYTCLNDVTARDLQKIDGQWTRSKGFDTFCPIGPCIETDLDCSDLRISATLNGKIVQDSSTKHMLTNIPDLIEYISSIMTLYKGDIISTGTPSGIGGMKDGDVIEIFVEGIGTLTNKVSN